MTATRTVQLAIITKRGNVLDTKRVTWTLALWCAGTFVLCVAYGVVAPPNLHTSAVLEEILPGFRWLTVPGFLIGLAESFVYGAYAGLTFCPLYNRVYRPGSETTR